MKFICKAFLVLVILSGIFFTSNSYAGDPIRKFGRGLSNIIFCFLEIPVTVYDVNQEEGGIAASTYGLAKGTGLTVARAVVGVTEVVTFLTPLPDCPDDPRDSGWGYGPMMRPEWIIDPEHNAYNIFYQDTAVMD
jgi:putative exosortase-associated protein (TIGR04073 family)